MQNIELVKGRWQDMKDFIKNNWCEYIMPTSQELNTKGEVIVKRTVPGFIWYLLREEFRITLCKIRGHKLVYEPMDNEKPTKYDFSCSRCNRIVSH